MIQFKKISFSLLVLSLGILLCGFTKKSETHILRETHNGVTMTYQVEDKTMTVSGQGEFNWDYTNFYNNTLKELGPETLTVEKGITSISLLQSDEQLKKISLPSTLTEINGAFGGCENLEQIKIPKNVTKITNSFSGCSKLKNVVIPKKVKQIHDSFGGCASLSTVSFQGAVEIKESFRNNPALKEISIPANSTLCSAFNGCSTLKTIRLGANVSCHDLMTEGCGESFLGRGVAERLIYADEPLHMDAATAITAGISELNMGYATTRLIPVPQKSGGDPSKVAIPPRRFSITFDEKSGTLTLAGTGRMKDLYPRTLDTPYEYWNYPALLKEDHKVKKLVIKEGITELFNCFNDLKAVEEILLPESLQKIEFSFMNCTALKELTIPKGQKKISGYSFDQCTALQKLTLQGSIDTCIIGGAFNGLESLRELSVPDGSTLCNSFKNCKKLEKVTLGDVSLHENLHEDENYCNGSFSGAKTNCTFYLSPLLKERLTNSYYYNPISDLKNYRLIVTD